MHPIIGEFGSDHYRMTVVGYCYGTIGCWWSDVPPMTPNSYPASSSHFLGVSIPDACTACSGLPNHISLVSGGIPRTSSRMRCGYVGIATRGRFRRALFMDTGSSGQTPLGPYAPLCLVTLRIDPRDSIAAAKNVSRWRGTLALPSATKLSSKNTL